MNDLRSPFLVHSSGEGVEEEIEENDKEALLENFKSLPCFALRQKFSESGYTFADLLSDGLSGIVVALLAIPLGMALAISTGVAPQQGLYTVIVAGSITAFLGGSRTQITGPTAAFCPVLVPVVERFGLQGLMFACMISGIFQIGMAFLGLGKLVRFMPDTVLHGFTAGIATVIFSQQLKDFFGISTTSTSDHFLGKMWILISNIGSTKMSEFLLGLLTLSGIILWTKTGRRIPAPIVVISAVTFFSFLFGDYFGFATIGSRFHFVVNGKTGSGIPSEPPKFVFPWNSAALSWIYLFDLLPCAFQISLLGAIESLLSATVADGIAGTIHNPDSELLAVGIGNVIGPFFGGIPATGAIARTATNIKFGARSPVSAIIHSLFVLVAVLFFTPVLAYVPMTGLAALLMFVAYNFGDPNNIYHLVKVSPKGDIFVLLVCYSLTVIFDMVVGISSGLIVAAVLFAGHMSSSHMSSQKRLLSDQLSARVGKQVVVVDIVGPLFFGTAPLAVKVIEEADSNAQAVVLLMENCSHLDISGAIALTNAVEKFLYTGKLVYVVGIKAAQLRIFQRLMKNSKNLDGLRIIDTMTTLQMAVKNSEDLPKTPYLRSLTRVARDLEALDG